MLDVYAPRSICWLGDLPEKSVTNILQVNQTDADIIASVNALPFKDDEFDLVVNNRFDETVIDCASGFTDIARVISPGGCLLSININPLGYLGLYSKLIDLELGGTFSTIGSRKSIGNKVGLQLLREVDLLYRPVCNDYWFNKLLFMEFVLPLLIPCCASIVISIWRKDIGGEVMGDYLLNNLG